MRTLITPLFAVALLSNACAQSPKADAKSRIGENAMNHVRAQVEFGPRPPGSEALEKCRGYLVMQLQSFGYTVEQDAFEAATPYGSKRMVNVIARKGNGGKGVIALASHFDTKLMEGKKFVGANDGGSSTGLLLELARVLSTSMETLDYWFIFLDGEEAFVDWSSFDSTYGSRHLAKRWKADGTAGRIKALILLDMIGDKNLDIFKDSHSTRWLSDLVWDSAAKSGLMDILSPIRTAIEDDHVPFLDAGIDCVDLIDLNYGPDNSYWHTEADTLDKISPESLEKTGKLVLAVLPLIQKRSF
jgi:Zn-dependent M28 family amino/carboxypeptidase